MYSLFRIVACFLLILVLGGCSDSASHSSGAPLDFHPVSVDANEDVAVPALYGLDQIPYDFFWWRFPLDWGEIVEHPHFETDGDVHSYVFSNLYDAYRSSDDDAGNVIFTFHLFREWKRPIETICITLDCTESKSIDLLEQRRAVDSNYASFPVGFPMQVTDRYDAPSGQMVRRYRFFTDFFRADVYAWYDVSAFYEDSAEPSLLSAARSDLGDALETDPINTFLARHENEALEMQVFYNTVHQMMLRMEIVDSDDLQQHSTVDRCLGEHMDRTTTDLLLLTAPEVDSGTLSMMYLSLQSKPFAHALLRFVEDGGVSDYQVQARNSRLCLEQDMTEEDMETAIAMREYMLSFLEELESIKLPSSEATVDPEVLAAQERDMQRKIDVNRILNAYWKYDTNFSTPPISLREGEPRWVCTRKFASCGEFVNISVLGLDPVPVDPQSSDERDAGYTILLQDGRLTVAAPHAELEPISVTR